MPRPRTVDDEQILTAAAQAVGDIGPARVTLADVGSRVGLSPAALLQRFGSKRGLLLALAATGIDAMPTRIRAIADDERIVESVVDVLSGFTSAIERPAQFANHLSFLLLDLSDPEFGELSRRHAESVRRALAEVLDLAVRRGEIVAGTDPVALARLVHAVYNGALLGWGLAPDGTPADAVRGDVAEVLRLVSAPRPVRGRGRRPARTV